MTTAWSHLPNASHIDSVIELAKSYPKVWDNAWGSDMSVAAWETVCAAAWVMVRYAAKVAECNEALNEAWDSGVYESWNAITGAILALIAYDDCAQLLHSDPKEVEVLAKLGSIPAILLLPACIVFNKRKI